MFIYGNTHYISDTLHVIVHYFVLLFQIFCSAVFFTCLN
ncbi:hypothetical protein FM106_28880 [Brachybacterium faecium]|nr:hypothetical protein FM106_28880 [Brachybacterium faecium]